MGEHWKRHRVSAGFVHVLDRRVAGVRWCAKLLPDGTCRIWRETSLVYNQPGHTKASARGAFDAATGAA